jgi:hypothetical protein
MSNNDREYLNISGLRGVFGDGTNLIINWTTEPHLGEQGQGFNASAMNHHTSPTTLWKPITTRPKHARILSRSEVRSISIA